MESSAAALNTIAGATWTGAIAFLSAIVAPAVFGVLTVIILLLGLIVPGVIGASAATGLVA